MLCTSSESKTDDSSSELTMEDDAAEASTAEAEASTAPGGFIPGPGRRGCLRPARGLTNVETKRQGPDLRDLRLPMKLGCHASSALLIL